MKDEDFLLCEECSEDDEAIDALGDEDDEEDDPTVALEKHEFEQQLRKARSGAALQHIHTIAQKKSVLKIHGNDGGMPVQDLELHDEPQIPNTAGQASKLATNMSPTPAATTAASDPWSVKSDPWSKYSATPTSQQHIDKAREIMKQLNFAPTPTSPAPAKPGLAAKFLMDMNEIRKKHAKKLETTKEESAEVAREDCAGAVTKKTHEVGIGTDLQIGHDISLSIGSAPPPPEQFEDVYDKHERVDWVEEDAGPVHVHRRRGDNGRQGKEVLWSEEAGQADSRSGAHPEGFEEMECWDSMLAEVTSDANDVLAVDAIDEEEEFKDPSTYASDPKKLKEYGLEAPLPPMYTDTRRGRKHRDRAPKKLRHKLLKIAQGCDCCDTPTAEVDEQAELQVAPMCLGCRLGIDDCTCNWTTQSWTTESGTGSLPAADDAKGSGGKDEQAYGTRSGETRTQSQEDAHALVWLMVRAIVATTAFAPTTQDIAPVDEGPKAEKSAATRLREKLASMVKIRRGLTVDSGAADHVMPISWLTWILMTMSLGALRGLHYASASGGRLPNLGDRVPDCGDQRAVAERLKAHQRRLEGSVR